MHKLRFAGARLDKRVAGDRAVRGQSFLDGAHEIENFLFGEMFDGAVPDDVVERTIRHLRADLGDLVRDVRRVEIAAGVVDGPRVEIHREDRAGAAAVKMMRVESVATTK